jgi:hypothetical protein
MDTTNIAYTPNILRQAGYNVKMNYDREGTAQSTSIPMLWSSGWIDLGLPDSIKALNRLYVFHEGTSGTLNVKVENFEGDEDTFAIDLSTNPQRYTEAFTTGKFIGQFFKVTITNDDDKPLKVKKIVLGFSDEMAAFNI